MLGFVPALVYACFTSGCGGGDSTAPAPVQPGQMKKAQEYLGSYREQMIEANKAKAKTKAAEAPKK
jgi:hypothetical protein